MENPPDWGAMPRIVLDTIGSNYQHIRELPCLKFGYLNGPRSAWPGAALAEQHARGELLALIDVLGTDPHQAAVLDWETGDVQDPDRLRWWVSERNGFRGDAVVYSDKSNLANVIGALHHTGEYYQLLVANLTPDGKPPAHPTDFQLPPNVRLLGEQYAWPAKTGGPYDLSILFNDSWHAASHAAAHLVGQAPAADVGEQADPAPDVPAPGELAAAMPIATFMAAATSTGDFDPAPAADPKAETPAGPTSSAPPWDLPFQMPAPPTTDLPPGTAMELQGRWGAIGPADVAADPGPVPDDQPFLGRPYLGAHAAATTAAAAPIDHAAVWRWIQAGQQFAEDFRTAGAGHVAGVLEQALGGVLEVGKLMSAIGR